MSLDSCLKQLHVVNIKVFLRMQHIHLLFFYSVIFQSWKFQSPVISTINSLSLNYPVFSISRTLLLVQSSKLISHVISLLALSTGSESLNASNTSSSHSSTKFSQLPNFLAFITSSLFSVLEVLPLHPSLSPVHTSNNVEATGNKVACCFDNVASTLLL